MVRIALAACAASPTWAAEKAAPQEESPVVVGRKDADGVQSYQPLTSVTGTRSETNLLNVPQAIDVVPQQVITDQAVSSSTKRCTTSAALPSQHAGRHP